MTIAAALAASGCPSSSSSSKELEASGQRWEVLGGSWKVVDGGGLVGSGGHVQTQESFVDGTIELDVELMTGPPGRTMGVAWRYDAEGGDVAKGSGYAANIMPGTNQYNVFRGDKGKWYPVNPAFTTFQPSPAIDPTRNHITIRARGASHTIEVNGKPLSTFNDATLAKGRLNFYVESPANEVKFSNIRVTK
jgi:hypothetical protein